MRLPPCVLLGELPFARLSALENIATPPTHPSSPAGAALWTGLLAGCAYSIMVRLMYRQHFYAMRRLAEQQSRDRRQADEPEEVV